ncbi:hypothetical protein AHAS_Ahas18G0233200 [Arachis hypogaea]
MVITCIHQSIETTDTLLDKKDAIIQEMNEKKELLIIEKNKMSSESAKQDEVDDSLDAYMSGLLSQLVQDKSVQLEKELSTLQSELDRIFYLLKIANPTGEAVKKRELKTQESKSNKSQEVASNIKKKPQAKTQKISEPCTKVDNKKPLVETQKISDTCAKADNSIQEGKHEDATMDLDKSEPGSDNVEGENVVYTVPKPQWLGAVEDMVTDDNQQSIAPLHDTDESIQFVDYKDRNKILDSGDDAKTRESNIESAAPSLILRKRKQVEMTGANSNDVTRQSTSAHVGEKMAENAMALLLKQKRELYATDDVENQDEEKRKPKRVLGPEKPSFLNNQTDDTWVSPQGKHNWFQCPYYMIGSSFFQNVHIFLYRVCRIIRFIEPAELVGQLIDLRPFINWKWKDDDEVTWCLSYNSSVFSRHGKLRCTLPLYRMESFGKQFCCCHCKGLFEKACTKYTCKTLSKVHIRYSLDIKDGLATIPGIVFMETCELNLFADLFLNS